jgi:hypothetical protein
VALQTGSPKQCVEASTERGVEAHTQEGIADSAFHCVPQRCGGNGACEGDVGFSKRDDAAWPDLAAKMTKDSFGFGEVHKYRSPDHGVDRRVRESHWTPTTPLQPARGRRKDVALFGLSAA